MEVGEPAGRPAGVSEVSHVGVSRASGAGAEHLPWAPFVVSGEQLAFYRFLNGFI